MWHGWLVSHVTAITILSQEWRWLTGRLRLLTWWRGWVDQSAAVDCQTQMLFGSEDVMNQKLSPSKVEAGKCRVVQIDVGHEKLRDETGRGKRSAVSEADTRLVDTIRVVRGQ